MTRIDIAVNDCEIGWDASTSHMVVKSAHQTVRNVLISKKNLSSKDIALWSISIYIAGISCNTVTNYLSLNPQHLESITCSIKWYIHTYVFYFYLVEVSDVFLLFPVLTFSKIIAWLSSYYYSYFAWAIIMTHFVWYFLRFNLILNLSKITPFYTQMWCKYLHAKTFLTRLKCYSFINILISLNLHRESSPKPRVKFSKWEVILLK